MPQPPAPYVPPPPPNPATIASGDVSAAGARTAGQRGMGFGSTIATGGEGLAPPAETGGKKLTGE